MLSPHHDFRIWVQEHSTTTIPKTTNQNMTTQFAMHGQTENFTFALLVWPRMVPVLAPGRFPSLDGGENRCTANTKNNKNKNGMQDHDVKKRRYQSGVWFLNQFIVWGVKQNMCGVWEVIAALVLRVWIRSATTKRQRAYKFVVFFDVSSIASIQGTKIASIGKFAVNDYIISAINPQTIMAHVQQTTSAYQGRGTSYLACRNRTHVPCETHEHLQRYIHLSITPTTRQQRTTLKRQGRISTNQKCNSATTAEAHVSRWKEERERGVCYPPVGRAGPFSYSAISALTTSA